MEKSHRKLAREKATIGVYQNLLVGCSLEDITTYLNEDKILRENKKSMDFCQWLVLTTLKNKDSYQNLIEKHLKKNWSFERLSVMERAILLIATCELLESDLDKKVVINEAVMNAKVFCDDDSYKFINGILSQVI
ncbi:transcription antitermination factor NusB [Candidatus Stoquefichus massiliensis]|uniref:transcription antitermination factor NusB n=1 Tax=Candidatus Stoquefichus massiliensis TaxID=1470350 RepID=UPI00047F86AA|nr:transcription antitermination factor NusB [Candidatus Stoquefichus massiliensis]